MKQTKKYSGACAILTAPHQSQDDLYQQLNRLGWFWDSKEQVWVRDDRAADPPSGIVRIRIMTATDKVEAAADAVIEAMQGYGLRFIERSAPYVCRPPQQLESRVYLTFQDAEQGGDRNG